MIPYYNQNPQDIIDKLFKAKSMDKKLNTQCPICGNHVEPKDFITSLRLQDDGSYRVFDLCRKCRDSGK